MKEKRKRIFKEITYKYNSAISAKYNYRIHVLILKMTDYHITKRRKEFHHYSVKLLNYREWFIVTYIRLKIKHQAAETFITVRVLKN